LQVRTLPRAPRPFNDLRIERILNRTEALGHFWSPDSPHETGAEDSRLTRSLQQRRLPKP